MTTKAPDILTAALGHMQDRAATYDKPEGERSMPATVAAFNAVTGLSLTAEQGWLFAILLKAVRSQQGGFKQDNYEDGAAYFALMGEQAAVDRVAQVVSKDPTNGVPLEPLADIEPGGATHRWTETDQYAKRVPGDGWAIWQEGQWVWLGSEFRGSMEPLPLWTAHNGMSENILQLKGLPGVLLHRDGTESQVSYIAPTGPYWSWFGEIERPTDIMAYRLA